MNQTLRSKLTALLGKDRCLTSPADCIPYGVDASPFQVRPEAVLLPDTTDEVAAILALANEYDFPITPRGAGSGLTGGSVPGCGGGILSLDRMNRILEIDTDNFTAVVQPGVVTAELNRAAAAHGLFFAPDPASAGFSTIGGNIAENAGGMRAVKYGVTKHSILGLEVVTPTGAILHTGSKCLKDVVGYGLTELFVGSEGTLGVICKAICKLIPLPAERNLVSAVFRDMSSAAATVLAVLHANMQPSAMEFLDRNCIRALEEHLSMPYPADARAQLLIEVDGDPEDVARRGQAILDICAAHSAMELKLARSPEEQDTLWRARRTLHNVLGKMNDHWHDEDVSVPVGRIPAMLDRLEAIRKEYGLLMPNLGHFGDGNIHISYAAPAGELTGEQLEIISERIYEATAELEGRIASEHGVGLAKKERVGWNLSQDVLDVMQGMKRLMDPKNILNPGKCFPGASCPGGGND
ncbi:FAD-binding oxidoreductase [Desulfovibrio caledoniensis]